MAVENINMKSKMVASFCLIFRKPVPLLVKKGHGVVYLSMTLHSSCFVLVKPRKRSQNY